MNIGVLGTGVVGETIAGKLLELGHQVRLGARAAKNEKASAWAAKAGSKASHGTFADAAGFGELVFNCTLGSASLAALRAAGEANLNGKVLVDISNPLDFSKGMPPSLLVCNTDSLGEQIQRAFPHVRVVKTLNTVTAALMVNPAALPGEHVVYLNGNDGAAKTLVTDLLRSFGWKQLVDLGDITTARTTEMILPLWVRLYMVQGTPMFNFRIVKADS